MPKIKNALIRYRAIDKRIRRKFKPYPTIDDLIEAIEDAIQDTISLSTVQKDIKAMKRENLFAAPIKYCPIYKGYKYTNPDFSLDSIPLTEEDLSSIHWAASVLSTFKGSSILEGFESAIDKVFARIEMERSRDLKGTIQVETSPSYSGNDNLVPMIEFIRNADPIQFVYRKFNHEKAKIHIVHPYVLREYHNRWYVIGLDDDLKQIRTYGLERIHELRVASGIKFIKDDQFDPELYFKHSFGITIINDQPPVDVELSFDSDVADFIKTQPWHHTQEVVNEDAHSLSIRMKVIPSMELIRQVLSYGNQVKVLSPEWLKLEVAGKK